MPAITYTPTQDGRTPLKGTRVVEVHCEYQPERIKPGDFMRVDFDVDCVLFDGLYLIGVDTWTGVRRIQRVPPSPTGLRIHEQGQWIDFSAERVAQTRILGLICTVYRAVDLSHTVDPQPAGPADHAAIGRMQ